ncbi:ABC transporter ATP-binding protein [Rhodobacter sp. 24-YEA-8]|uniref:iron ABC transporter ATP-binding protein n=1 Tax=Rhodobacter sp. 24-YEA-8 TaxID=1884310 RepID=UPI00089CBF92|nr:ATP-binding cassette domain-containing protein [Rhodobacter sp. 24-YEA-8]SEC51450.1 iron complex transport system ATP-binding protein [Rhodobacter sp. 24-YEA-8]
MSPDTAMITTTDLSMKHGNRLVLSGLTTAFPQGRLSAIIGPNGAGKSTLLMLMARLASPSGGRVTVAGQDIATIPPAAFARQVATLRQSPGVDLRLTVGDLVAFGRFPYSRGRLDAADRRAIDDAIARLALDPLRDTLIDELSGGQRQMAFLAMTIAQDTPCLLLDEPLNNLDIRHAAGIMRALRDLCADRGRSVIAVVHDINFAANSADHILALKSGRLHSAGPVDQVITEPNLQDLYGLDFRILPRPQGRICDYFTPKGEPA